MLRIIHLTDFHLNPKNYKDWNDYVKGPMIETLKTLNDDAPINLIAFTGDIIEKGGQDYRSANEAFNLFKLEVINPLIRELKLNSEDFLITPGNHDVVRTLDTLRDEYGNLKYFEEKSNISEFILNAIKKNDFSGMKRITPYKDFEKDLYKDIQIPHLLTVFGSSFVLGVEKNQIGICCLNSAWRCYNSNDCGNILIGEEQLKQNYEFIKHCSIKIALIHHPVDILSPVERGIISDHIYKYFDLMLIGHSHESITSLSTGITGTLFINLAPTGLNDIRQDSRTFSNGFTVIDYKKELGVIDCEYWRYNHTKIEFVLNTDASIGKDGRSHFDIPKGESAKKITIVKAIISNIMEDHFPEMDEHLMGVKAKINDFSIKDAFVLPPIDQGKSSGDDDVLSEIHSITQIVQHKSNLIFFGNREAGRTTLLYRLVHLFLDEFEYIRKIPVYIDFEEIKNKDIVSSIKAYLRCSSSDVKELLSSNQIVLLIDNLRFKKGYNKDQINKIHSFFYENEAIQIIATSESDFIGIMPEDYLTLCKIPFMNFFIRNLGCKEIKSIMKLWLPGEDELKTEDRLDKLVTSFNSFALPSNAMSVSLFIWSTEFSKVKPINNAVLMEIYIEIILEKLREENIYRGSFDFKNKVQLLAKIAQEMLINNQTNYSISYSQFAAIIENYLKFLVGFTHDPEVIINYFLERKLFVKYQDDRIKFTHSCFFHFFIAKRMEFDPEFRAYILDNERYFLYPKEIDYYTGLVRSDKATFELILGRFQDLFQPIEGYWELLGDLDKYFTPLSRDPEKQIEPLAKNVDLDKIKDNRPSEEVMEKYYNQKLSKIPDSDYIPKNDGDLTLERLIIIMANVLRNSEGVEDLELKRSTYNLLVKYTVLFAALYRESILYYIQENKKRPSCIPPYVSLDYFLTNIPLSVQLGFSKHVGTQKLSSIIAEKIKKDNTAIKPVSNIEAFMSVALYADIQGNGFEKFFKKFIKQLKTNFDNHIVANFALYKLTDYYYRRTRKGSDNELMYLDLIAELRIKTQKLPRKMKETIIKAFTDSKFKFLKGR